jgi:SpoIID/LytB domain protein
VPLPPRLHAPIVRRTIVVPLVAFAVYAAGLRAQDEVTDAQLIAASAGATIRVGSPATGAFERYPLEVYVARVLAGEAEPRAADAAHQALAVAIRTFAVANEGRHGREGFDLCDTTHCQVARAATGATRRAALATAGRILTFEGRPAELFYSASCGGRTESAEAMWPGGHYPYLRSVEDDVHEDDSEWRVEFSLADIQAALQRMGHAGLLTDVAVEERSASDRVTRLRLEGLTPSAITGDRFRAALGNGIVRSTAFALDVRDEVARFTGRGYGHGVGLCVIGAGRRARRGEAMEQILGAYFPGLVLRSPSSAIPVRASLRALRPLRARAMPPSAAGRACSATASRLTRRCRGPQPRRSR